MQALTHGVVWAMSRTTFRDIVLAGRVQKRARYEEVLGDMEIFQYLSAANRSSIADCLTAEVYQVRCAAKSMACKTCACVEYVVQQSCGTWRSFSACLQPRSPIVDCLTAESIRCALRC